MRLSAIRTSFAFAALLLALTGCDQATKQLDLALETGSPFNKALAKHYRILAKDYGITALAPKGLAAVDGVLVMPEPVSSIRDLELIQARNVLMYVLNQGGRDMAPYQAADAQSAFDCWVVSRLKRKRILFDSSTAKNLERCKAEFHVALGTLVRAINDPTGQYGGKRLNKDNNMGPVVPAPYEDLVRKGPYASLSRAKFLVFFEWDKDQLTPGALNVIHTIAEELHARRQEIKKIHIVGHADTSGGREYNEGLSVRRAINVSEALVALGIDHQKIIAEGRGEKELLVQTPDNIREPSNRRAQITLE